MILQKFHLKKDNVIIHPNNGGNKEKLKKEDEITQKRRKETQKRGRETQKRRRETKKRGREASKKGRGKETKAWLDRYFFLTIVPLQ